MGRKSRSQLVKSGQVRQGTARTPSDGPPARSSLSEQARARYVCPMCDRPFRSAVERIGHVEGEHPNPLGQLLQLVDFLASKPGVPRGR